MKSPAAIRHPSGYVSYLMVLTLGTILLAVMVFAYRRATIAHATQSAVQLQFDYAEKEESRFLNVGRIILSKAHVRW